MTRGYYSNGKLIISGEYLVLKGAKALVFPLRLGQDMQVEQTEDGHAPMITWQANINDQPWFSAKIAFTDWKIVRTTDTNVADRLIKLLAGAAAMNNQLFDPAKSIKIVTRSAFPMNWGFGSSSALITNLAKWAEVDPFDLFFRVSVGSGADIAGALSPGPVLYRLEKGKPVISPVRFNPPFRDQIWFVYLGQKQNTEKQVHDFNANTRITEKQIESIDLLTDEMLQAQEISGFKKAVREHETFMESILHQTKIHEERFSDFPGEIKSLGAWGGDFAMVISEKDEESLRTYFNKKGLDILLSFNDIVLDNSHPPASLMKTP